jgi:conjugative transfer region protein TrbK
MSDRQDPMRLTMGVGATIVLLAMAGMSVFSAREYSTSLPSLIAVHDRSTEGQELEHCRTITPQQYASDDACRRAWAEQRQRFFGLDQQGSKASITNVPTSPSLEPATEIKNKLNALHPTAPPPQKD